MRTYVTVAALLAAVTMSGAALAGGAPAPDPVPPFYINYQINLPAYAVSDITLFEHNVYNGYGITNSSGFNAGVGTTTITDPFTKIHTITGNFLLGITSNLPGDAEGQQHLVLFSNPAFDAGAQGIAFGTLFPNTDEDSLIAAITTVDTGTADPSVIQAAYNTLFGFANGDSMNGPNGNVAFGSNNLFAATAFSNGLSIGAGNSFTTPAGGGGGAVPEPASWALLVTGFGVLGHAARRRRSALHPA